MGIIIFGASGAGSTTLGKELAKRLDFQYLDIDDYLWRWDTAIPFTITCSQEERANSLMSDIKKYPNFVLAGTIFSDRHLFHPLLDMAVFISAPVEVCAERVRKREHARWGNRVLLGGDMYKATRFHGDDEDYIANAERYETADVSKFGRKMHEKWIEEMPCPVIRVDGMKGVDEYIDAIISLVNKQEQY